MTADKPSHLVPRLRFPEFIDHGPWHAKPLDDLCDRLSETVGDTQLTPVSISAGKGFVPQAEKFGRDISGSQYSKYIWLQRGDFAYNRGNSKRFPQGCVYQLTEFDEAAASNAFHCFRLHDHCEPAFVLGFFENNGHGRQLIRYITSGARSNGLLNISAGTFFGITVPVPPTVVEQQKIADCLGSLDDLITAEGRKLDALQQHKQGLMQNVLPQDGNALPAVRFSQYRDAEAWNVTRLGDIADYENGKAYEKDIVDNGRFVVVNARFISTDVAVRKYTNETYCIAQTSDVLMVLSDLPSAKALARCFLVDADDTYAVNQRVAKLRPRSVDSKFLLYALDQHPWLMAFSDGINQTHLSKGSVLDCPLAVPRDDGEQKLIGECLGAVDSRVTAQEAKLAVLTRHKNGLLQQLFPSPEEESR